MLMALTSLTLLCVDGPNALLQPQQALVDLSRLDLPIFAVSLAVGSSFAPSQVHQQQFSTLFHPFLLYLDLADCVRPRRGIIRVGSMGGAYLISLVD